MTQICSFDKNESFSIGESIIFNFNILFSTNWFNNYLFWSFLYVIVEYHDSSTNVSICVMVLLISFSCSYFVQSNERFPSLQWVTSKLKCYKVILCQWDMIVFISKYSEEHECLLKMFFFLFIKCRICYILRLINLKGSFKFRKRKRW
jgi:hypothetical protein